MNESETVDQIEALEYKLSAAGHLLPSIVLTTLRGSILDGSILELVELVVEFAKRRLAATRPDNN